MVRFLESRVNLLLALLLVVIIALTVFGIYNGSPYKEPVKPNYVYAQHAVVGGRITHSATHRITLYRHPSLLSPLSETTAVNNDSRTIFAETVLLSRDLNSGNAPFIGIFVWDLVTSLSDELSDHFLGDDTDGIIWIPINDIDRTCIGVEIPLNRDLIINN